MEKFLEVIINGQELYDIVMQPVCEKHGLTHTEIAILMFLSENSSLDTATDISEKRSLTKSAVSMAVHSLAEKGLVTGEFFEGNHRSIHLRVNESAAEIVSDGLAAQDKCFAVLTDGFEKRELDDLRSFIERISKNISSQNKETTVQ